MSEENKSDWKSGVSLWFWNSDEFDRVWFTIDRSLTTNEPDGYLGRAGWKPDKGQQINQQLLDVTNDERFVWFWQSDAARDFVISHRASRQPATKAAEKTWTMTSGDILRSGDWFVCYGVCVEKTKLRQIVSSQNEWMMSRAWHEQDREFHLASRDGFCSNCRVASVADFAKSNIAIDQIPERIRAEVIKQREASKVPPAAEIDRQGEAKAESTDRYRKIIKRAEQIAVERKHPYIATDDLLLAMIDDPESIAMRVIIGSGTTPDRIREEINKWTSELPPPPATPVTPPSEIVLPDSPLLGPVWFAGERFIIDRITRAGSPNTEIEVSYRMARTRKQPSPPPAPAKASAVVRRKSWLEFFRPTAVSVDAVHIRGTDIPLDSNQLQFGADSTLSLASAEVGAGK